MRRAARLRTANVCRHSSLGMAFRAVQQRLAGGYADAVSYGELPPPCLHSTHGTIFAPAPCAVLPSHLPGTLSVHTAGLLMSSIPMCKNWPACNRFGSLGGPYAVHAIYQCCCMSFMP